MSTLSSLLFFVAELAQLTLIVLSCLAVVLKKSHLAICTSVLLPFLSITSFPEVQFFIVCAWFLTERIFFPSFFLFLQDKIIPFLISYLSFKSPFFHVSVISVLFFASSQRLSNCTD